MIKTIIIFVITGIAAIILLPIGIPLFIFNVLGFKHSTSFLLYKCAQGWARLVIAMMGCSMTVTGRENILKKGGVCFVSNHVGIFDIILALVYTGRPFGFVAKKELLLVPGINIWIFLLGGLFIDRKQPRKALKTINKGIKRIKGGGAMLIFPEGTRSRGRGMGTFHPGSLKLATQSDAIIIPMAVSGSYDVFEKNHRAMAAPVSLHFLAPVYPAEIPPQDRKILLAQKLHDIIAEALNPQ